MPAKLTFAEVKKTFSDAGCELLAKFYSDALTKMSYICSCGNKSEIRLNDFKKGNRCQKCSNHRRSETHRCFNLEQIQEIFRLGRCTLLATEYINSRTKMPYICECGNEAKICFSKFQQGQRCIKCSGNKKLTFTEVKKIFSDAGCVLLATEYINNSAKMPYICSCGNKAEILLYNFKKGKRCMKCGIAKSAEAKRNSFEEVKSFFVLNGCTLLATEYINNSTKMPYICSCGNKAEIRFKDFKKSKRCMKCSGNEKLTFAEVKNFFKNNNCVLLSTEYVNNRTKMPYVCECGNESEICFAHFQQGNRCKKCRIKKVAKCLKFPYKYIKEFFEDNGCTLLATEYINNSTKMPYICSCGNEAEISFDSFQHGTRCRECGIKKIAERFKHTYEYVKMFFELQRCTLLATEYINSVTKMPYICSCSNETKCTFRDFTQGHRCKKCGIKKIWDIRRQNEETWGNTEIDFDFLDRILEERIKEIDTEN